MMSGHLSRYLAVSFRYFFIDVFTIYLFVGEGTYVIHLTNALYGLCNPALISTFLTKRNKLRET